jgi:hypothetical protein
MLLVIRERSACRDPRFHVKLELGLRRESVLNEADRIAKERARQAVAKRDQEAREARAQVQADAQALKDEVTQLVAELLALLRQPHALQDVEPVEVLAYRFPPLGDLFGNRSKARGGWVIGRQIVASCQRPVRRSISAGDTVYKDCGRRGRTA